MSSSDSSGSPVSGDSNEYCAKRIFVRKNKKVSSRSANKCDRKDYYNLKLERKQLKCRTEFKRLSAIEHLDCILNENMGRDGDWIRSHGFCVQKVFDDEDEDGDFTSDFYGLVTDIEDKMFHVSEDVFLLILYSF